MTDDSLKFRPYARLLTMLGEQLIKNDRIALVEVVKNSYDADAHSVTVDFSKFEDDFSSSDESAIIITDDGDGMSEAVVRDHWLNPASPGKANRKLTNPKTARGRVMQGEKGIGRFAIFKLGSEARVVTRDRHSESEIVLSYDLRFLDGPVEEVDGAPPAPLYLDQVPVGFERRAPEVFDGQSKQGLGSTHGTRLEIGTLRTQWNEQLVRQAFSEVARLQSLETRIKAQSEKAPTRDFEVSFKRDGHELNYQAEDAATLRRLFEDRTVFKLSGSFDPAAERFSFTVNGTRSTLPLSDPTIRGLQVFRDYFENEDEPLSTSGLECGPFSFSFYVFDLSGSAPIEYRLDPDEKRLVKEHRIYLYRDGIRVLPYGDPEDDWLQVDVIRGTQRASRVLSNDQTVGFVNISQEQNPRLRDKTNREGLLESGRALGDFVALLQIFLAHTRVTLFANYLENERRKRKLSETHQRVVESRFEQVLAIKQLPSGATSAIKDLQKSYRNEKQYFETRADRTEDLAGVGLSVEAASHDVIAMATRSLRLARTLHSELETLADVANRLIKDSASLVEALSFVTSRLQDIQGLFVSSRQKRTTLEPRNYVDRVSRIFASALEEGGVALAISEPSKLSVKTTEAALLQTLINLFDNSLYWLEAARVDEPMISIELDGGNRRIRFADNGPGVKDQDVPYIFEPFFSGKGESGKGLGLYIARQVGVRNGFTVDYVDQESHRLLPGANFVIEFAEG